MKDKKNLTIVVLLLLLAGAAGYYFLSKDDEPSQGPGTATVEQLPAPEGVVLTLPNTDADGNERCAPEYDGSTVDNGTASKKYKPTDCKPVAILEIPIDGPCPIDPNTGVIGAPSDWTRGCSYKGEEGGMAYLGHSVRGPRVGAFERIHELQPGQLVKVDEKVFKVVAVNKFRADNLPHRLWTKNHFSLITCYIDAAAEAGGEITQDTVVELTDEL